ncbi:hypothetical protein [Kribbella sp. NPDC051718]|uniref:hypothetical protein n=1 Tax=Kribbella sp. NPDC051718 TaxID=3155168 RepID=UPI003437827B
MGGLDSVLRSSSEVIYDSGPARCKEVDRYIMDVLEHRHGGARGARQYAKSLKAGPMVLEANWVVSDKAFYYAYIYLPDLLRYGWGDVTGISIEKTRFPAGGWLTLDTLSDGLVRIHMGPQALGICSSVYNNARTVGG